VSLPLCSEEHAALAGIESLWRFLESDEHMGSSRSGVWGAAELTSRTIGGNPEPSFSLSDETPQLVSSTQGGGEPMIVGFTCQERHNEVRALGRRCSAVTRHTTIFCR